MKSLVAFLVLLGAGACFYFHSQPAPRAHRYSADNVFYLRQYVSFRTRTGIVGLLPGQEMSLSARAPRIPGKVMVTDGKGLFALDPDLLTHDIDEADTLQATLQAGMAQIKQSTDLLVQAEQATMADGVNASGALQASQNTVGTYRTRLNDTAAWAGAGSYGGAVYYGTAAAAPARAPGSAAGSGTFAPVAPATSGVSLSSSHSPAAGGSGRPAYNALSTSLGEADSPQ
jgi:hypothetical protein